MRPKQCEDNEVVDPPGKRGRGGAVQRDCGNCSHEFRPIRGYPARSGQIVWDRLDAYAYACEYIGCATLSERGNN